MISSRAAYAHAEERIASGTLFSASAFVIVAMGALIVYLAYMGLQLFLVDHVSPLTFLFSSNFSPVDRHPGALVFIIGSVSITLFAIAVGGPLGVAVGIFLSLMAPQRLANAMKPAIEILVGIPSVVYGWLGLTFEMCRQRLKDPSIDAGFVADSCAHALLDAVGRVPGLPAELVCAAAPEHR